VALAGTAGDGGEDGVDDDVLMIRFHLSERVRLCCAYFISDTSFLSRLSRAQELRETD
jgi:hypothetical protein